MKNILEYFNNRKRSSSEDSAYDEYHVEYFDFDDLSVQEYSVKLMYKGQTIKEPFQNLNSDGEEVCNFYEKIELPGVFLHKVKVWENVGKYNHIHIENIETKKNGKILYKYLRTTNKNDREKLFFE